MPSTPKSDRAGNKKPQHRSLGEALVKGRVITQEQLEAAVEEQEKTGEFVGQALVDLGFVTQNAIISFIVKECKVPHLSLMDYEIGNDLLDLVPKELCARHRLIPIDKLGRILTVAMVDPLDVEALDEVRERCPDLRIKAILCDWPHFKDACAKLFGETITAAPKQGAVTMDGLGLSARSPAADSVEKDIPAMSAEEAPPTSQPESVPASTPSTTRQEAPTTARETSEILSGELAHVMKDAIQEAVQKAVSMMGSAEAEAAAVAAANRQDLTAPGVPRAQHESVSPFRPGGNGEAGLDEEDRRVYRALNSEEPREAYTFANFHAGETNAFTLKLAGSVAEAPGGDHNPFFLYGPVGVGKTHLVNAIGNAICDGPVARRVGYVSASHFARRLTRALHDQALDRFRENYCQWDVLILDDIQFLGGRVEAQEEFFHIFNLLHQEDRQIIIASDKAPEKLGLLEKRLVSRFASGVVTELKAPEMDTRMVILREHVARTGVTVPESILTLLAIRVPDDVRMMVGALRKVVAFAGLVGQDIDHEMVTEILSHLGGVDAA